MSLSIGLDKLLIGRRQKFQTPVPLSAYDALLLENGEPIRTEDLRFMQLEWNRMVYTEDGLHYLISEDEKHYIQLI